MALYKYGEHSKTGSSVPSGPSEFDILKASHKFLRKDEENEKDLAWNEQVAKKYYSSLFREFAVCDLKHYKSGNFSLRWRTEDEVVLGAGETTCGNTRCPLHDTRYAEDFHPSLKTLELPFSYVEHGENQFALVKVVLCDKCVKKLMWKRNKEKKEQEATANEDNQESKVTQGGASQIAPIPTSDVEPPSKKRGFGHRDKDGEDLERRRHSSRSRSPVPRKSTSSRDHERRRAQK